MTEHSRLLIWLRYACTTVLNGQQVWIDAVNTLADMAVPGDVVMLMGAGNETVVGNRLLDDLHAM